MTTLKDTLKADLTTRLKAGDRPEMTVLRSVLGEIQYQEKAGKSSVEFGDAEVLSVIGKEVKKRRDTASIYTEAGQTDRAAVETFEADFLSAYLPAQLTENEIKRIIEVAIQDMDAPNFGQVMKIVSADTRGRADGRLVSELVKAKLG